MSDLLSDEDDGALRALAIKHLQVHLARNPNTQPLLEALVSNASAWGCGFNSEEFHYWILPVTADERMLPGPMHVLRWDWHDFQAIKNYRQSRPRKKEDDRDHRDR